MPPFYAMARRFSPPVRRLIAHAEITRSHPVTLNTAFLLMAENIDKAIIRFADVCREYFSHLTPELLRKV